MQELGSAILRELLEFSIDRRGNDGAARGARHLCLKLLPTTCKNFNQQIGCRRRPHIIAGAMPIEPGSRIGPYEVIARLGEGGTGLVFRGRDVRLQRDVALKLLPAF